MSLLSKLSFGFPRQAFKSGYRYYYEGLTKVISGDEHSAIVTVGAPPGSQVQVRLDDGAVSAWCTCSEDSGEPCGHLCAAILAAEKIGFLRGYVSSDGIDWIAIEKPASGSEPVSRLYSEMRSPWQRRSHRPAKPPKPPKNLWRQKLSAARTASNAAPRNHWPPTREVLYVVDAESAVSAGVFCIEIFTRDRKQNGEWRVPKRAKILPSEISTLPGRADRELLAMLSGAKSAPSYYGGYSYPQDVPDSYHLASPLSDMVAPLACETGRCYLRPASELADLCPLQWDGGDAWKFSVEVSKHPGSWIIQGLLSRGDLRMDLKTPEMLIQGGYVFTRERMARLDDGGAFPWIALLRREGVITVPEKDGGDLLAELMKDSNPPPLRLPEELRVEEVQVTPRLRLKVDALRQYGTQRLTCHLAFDYEGISVPFDSPGRGLYIPEARRFLLRDRQAEDAAVQRLREVGVQFVPPKYYQKQSHWEMPQSRLPRVARELVPAG
jgi:SWIM zinc finger